MATVSQSPSVSAPVMPPVAMSGSPSTVRQGSNGPDVEKLQQALAAKGLSVKVDGRFGAGTAEAVRSFQAQHQLKADGVVGPATWLALLGAGGAVQTQVPVAAPMQGAAPASTQAPAGAVASASGTTATVRPGARGPEVVELQTLLNARGYDVGTPDGKFGNGTKAQVMAFQSSRGLTADGVVGRRTWEALRDTSPVINRPPPSTGGTPPRYFAFSSSGLSTAKVNEIINRYGNNVLIGFDAGNIPDGALGLAKSKGAKLHIYVEGPGGVTGSSGWAADELARVKAAARSVGIDTSQSQSSWMREWNSSGYKAFTRKQLADFKRQGFDSAEIDNLYNDSSIGEGGSRVNGMINFYKTYASWWRNGEVPRLMIKNNDEEQLRAVASAISSGALPRAMFSDFAIAEQGVGSNRATQAQIAKTFGVQMINSNDTYNYDAYGEYRAG